MYIVRIIAIFVIVMTSMSASCFGQDATVNINNEKDLFNLGKNYFTVIDGEPLIPKKIPLNISALKRLRKILSCLPNSGHTIESLKYESKIKRLISLLNNTPSRRSSEASYNNIRSRFQNSYDQAREELMSAKSNGTLESCMKKPFRSSYGSEAPGFCSEVYPTFDSEELEDIYKDQPQDAARAIICENQKQIEITPRKIIDNLKKLRNTTLANRRDKITFSLKKNSIDKLMKLRSRFDTFLGKDEGSAKYNVEKCSLKGAEKSKSPERDKNELTKFILLETQNALILKALLVNDNNEKFSRNSSSCLYEFRRGLVKKPSIGCPSFEGHKDADSYREVLSNQNWQEGSEKNSPLINELIDRSDYFFNFNKNYKSFSGQSLLRTSSIANNLTEGSSDALLKRIAKEVSIKGEGFNGADFFKRPENAAEFNTIVGSKINNKKSISDFEESFDDYQNEIDESIKYICNSDDDFILHHANNAMTNLKQEAPDLFKDEDESLLTQMTWCSLFYNKPYKNIGLSRTTKLGMAGVIIGLPLLAVPVVGTGVYAALAGVTLTGSVIDYKKSRARRSVVRGGAQLSYFELDKLHRANSDFNRAKVTLAVESTLAPLIMLDAIRILASAKILKPQVKASNQVRATRDRVEDNKTLSNTVTKNADSSKIQELKKLRESLSEDDYFDHLAKLVITRDKSDLDIINYVKSLDNNSKATLLSKTINMQNKFDAAPFITKGTDLSNLSTTELEKALYAATRLTSIDDYFSAISKLKKSPGKKMDNHYILEGGELSNPIKYLSKKSEESLNPTGVMPIEVEHIEMILSTGGEANLIVSLSEARNLMKNDQVLKMLKESENFHLTVTDQFSNSITPFNFRDPKAVSRSLKYYNEDQASIAQKEFEGLGLGDNVKVVVHDSNPAALTSSSPLKMTVNEAIVKIEGKTVTKEDVLEMVANSKSITSKDTVDKTLSLAILEGRFSTFQTIGNKVGGLIQKTNKFAKENGYDNIYYFSGADTKSTDLYLKLLQESYGVSPNQIINSNINVLPKGLLDPSQKNLVLLVDDFIGSGDSMNEAIAKANKLIKQHTPKKTKLNYSTHAVVPYATRVGAAKVQKKSKVIFVDTNLDGLFNTNTYKSYSGETAFIEKGHGRSKDGTTMISFEYMSPDNNARGSEFISSFWTHTEAIK